MEARDVLADHVQLRRPSLVVACVGIASLSQIVRQSIEPDPGPLRVARRRPDRKRNRPRQLRSRDRDILETLLEQSEDLVPPGLRLDEPRTAGDELFQKWRVLRQAKEPVPLLGPLE